MPRLDEKTWKVIEERYKRGESIYALAKEYGISHSAIIKHMKNKGIERKSNKSKPKGNSKSKEVTEEEAIIGESIPDRIQVSEEEAEEIKDAVQDKLDELDREMAEIDKIRNRIYEQLGGSPGVTSPFGVAGDLQSLLWELDRRKKEYERMKKKLMEMVGVTETTGTLNAKGLLSLKEQLDATVEEAKKVLEQMGYKVVPADTPTNIEEAKRMLQEAGYEIKSTVYTKEDLEREIERIRRELEEKYKKEADKQAQSVRVDGAVKVVEMVIDRIFSLFEPYVKPQVTQVVEKAGDKKQEVKKVINMLRAKSKEITSNETEGEQHE